MEEPRGRRIKRGSWGDGIRGTSGTEKFKGKAKGGVERGQNRNEEISGKERLRGGLSSGEKKKRREETRDGGDWQMI